MKNYYIERDENKKIIGVFARPQYKGQKKLKETDKEMKNYLKKQSEPTETELNEQKIQVKMRQIAIEALQANGELPVNFENNL